MPSIPWKYICVYLLLRIYGPEITSEKIYNYFTLLSVEYCRNEEDKADCSFEQIKGLVLLANDTYYAVFANFTTYIEQSGIKSTIQEYLGTKKQHMSELYTHPSSTPNEKVNVSTAISTMLNQMQQKTLPDSSMKEVKERLKTIATKYRRTKGFCTMKIGVDPLVVFNLISEVAQMTNMPRHLQNILENAIKVMDAESSMTKNEEFASKGMVHYILIAAYRNGKI